ncbi:MAG: hypothetical protein HC896_06205 [Bacteroidales bacterium]|nr:hypothetical protein [Bacteroidales bacterium]
MKNYFVYGLAVFFVMACADEPCNESLYQKYKIAFYKFDKGAISALTLDTLVYQYKQAGLGDSIFNNSFFIASFNPNDTVTQFEFEIKFGQIISDSVPKYEQDTIGWKYDTIYLVDSCYAIDSISGDTVRHDTCSWGTNGWVFINSEPVTVNGKYLGKKYEPVDTIHYTSKNMVNFTYRIETKLISHNCGFKAGFANINPTFTGADSTIKEIIVPLNTDESDIQEIKLIYYYPVGH